MAKYSTADGVRGITGEDGYGWLPEGTRWVCTGDPCPIAAGNGLVYTLEKRRRNTKDGTHDTGWYLYGSQPNTFFGEWCGRRILEAVDEAGRLIFEAEKD